MDYGLSEDQEELGRAVRRFLEERSPVAEVRRLMATPEGYDPAVWSQMAEELGLQGLGLPEEHGGAGTFAELVVVLEEMGRVLLCAPFLSTVVLAGHALLASGDQGAARDLLPGVVSGHILATLAFVEDGGSWDLGATSTVARETSGAWHLDGHKSFVVDGQVADVVLVVARAWGGPVPSPEQPQPHLDATLDPTLAGLSLFAVEAGAPGLTRTPLPTLDPTRRQARIELAAAPARLVGRVGGAGAGLSHTLDLAGVALAAEQVGGAQRCLEMSVEHAKTRVQFGRPIGSFQAIKHRCAEMLAGVESARSAAWYAAGLAAEGSADLSAAASVAQARCSEAYFQAAAETIQVHGGIGFTWEHDAHLYFRRAKSAQLMLGDPSYHKERLVRGLGI